MHISINLSFLRFPCQILKGGMLTASFHARGLGFELMNNPPALISSGIWHRHGFFPATAAARRDPQIRRWSAPPGYVDGCRLGRAAGCQAVAGGAPVGANLVALLGIEENFI